MSDDFTLEDAQSALDNAPYHAIRILRAEIDHLRARLAAVEYVTDQNAHMCSMCKEEVRAALAGDRAEPSRNRDTSGAAGDRPAVLRTRQISREELWGILGLPEGEGNRG